MSISLFLQLIRAKHYLKNVLVFLPLVFSGYLLKLPYLEKTALAFICFSLVASAVYIINDLRDRQEDAQHATRKHRPIASGRVSPGQAAAVAVALLALTGLLTYLGHLSLASGGLLALYLAINLAYSFGLKNIPILDVAILSLGFVLRVYYGGTAIGIVVSNWLYLCVLAFSFYLSLGKRRGELRANGATTRRVNRYYNQDFLDKNMYVCLGLTIVYYSLWATDPMQKHHLIVWTVPVIIAIVMTYSLAIESTKSDGDPVSVVLGHKPLLALVAFYGVLITSLVYI